MRSRLSSLSRLSDICRSGIIWIGSRWPITTSWVWDWAITDRLHSKPKHLKGKGGEGDGGRGSQRLPGALPPPCGGGGLLPGQGGILVELACRGEE